MHHLTPNVMVTIISELFVAITKGGTNMIHMYGVIDQEVPSCWNWSGMASKVRFGHVRAMKHHRT